ncbi:Neuroglian [Fragariocoptes setiger]|uniref:Neuroglian n=1 Tax=Fragariocoptes setiger TaxID=1670756 RepID=A0ABQ7S717_9ACAR|nr:Neuroglian [Fragariocoptes setiger]
MLKQPAHEQLFQVALGEEENHPITLDCEAQAVPEPRYWWTKNGARFDYVAYDKRISQKPKLGTLIFTKPDYVDEGLYQCFAENEHGISMSNSVFLRKSELASFPEEHVREFTVDEGQPYTIECSPPSGYPKPSIFWMMLSSTGALHSINSTRLTVDPEGRLHFSNITKADQLENALYACSATSKFRSEYKVGRKTRLIVQASSSAGRINNSPPVEQYISPPNIAALRGQKLLLHCIYGGTPLPDVVWRKRGGSLEGNRFSYINYGKTLVIFKVDDTDEGTYECTASNGNGNQQTHAMTVTVSSEPYWVLAPNNTNAAQDESVQFECQADGKPKPTLQWLLNGSPLDAKKRPSLKIDGNKLYIDSLKKSDIGVYQCNASNVHGYAFRDFYLNVLDLPPVVIEPPERTARAVASSTVTLKCRVFGAPKPEVKWRRDNIELSGGRYKVLETGDLQISQVMPTDQGKYECHAINKFGDVKVYGELQVKGKTKIIQPPENLELPASKTAVFRCNAESDSTLQLQVSWLYNGKTIDFDSDPRMIQSRDNSLSISKTKELDSGNYTCLAKSELDSVSARASLVVQDVPNPPKILGIECENFAATIEWTPTGDRRAPILSYDIQYNTSFSPDVWKVAFVNVPAPDNKFTVALNPWSNYTFRVIAKNKIGSSLPSDSSQVCTTEKAVPYKNPADVKGRGTQPNNLVISWTPMPPSEHHGPNFFYKVYWRRNDIPQEYSSQIIRDWKENKFVVTNQPTYVPYRIKVEAYNQLGQANIAAKEEIGYSGQNVPLQAPKSFHLKRVINPTKAQFAWDPVPPESIRGKFKGYKIQAWVDDKNTQIQEVVLGDTTFAEVDILKPFSNNSVQIMAINEVHNGPASFPPLLVTTPEGVPDPVSQMIAIPMGSNAFYLAWKKPENMNGMPTGYEIYYEEVIGTEIKEQVKRQPSIDDPAVTRAKLSGLKPNTKYRITIRAKTRVGEGAPYFIEASTKGGQETVPDIPTFIWSSLPDEDGRSGITVTWIPNTAHNSPGSSFYVQFKRFGESQWQKSPIEANSDSIQIRGLDVGSLYEVRVVAVDGTYSTASRIQEISTNGYVHQESIDHLSDPGWLIGLLCAIAIVITIFVLVCLINHNRGGRYLVHEKEEALGRDKDYEATGFNEYEGPATRQPLRENDLSLGEMEDSDTDSMTDDYEGDRSKFEEDGSFIGQYGVKPRKPEPPSVVTFV